jgi:hypothetical protein
MTSNNRSIEVFVGVDVCKGAHHAVALDITGKRLLDHALPNDEAKLRAPDPASVYRTPGEAS